MPKEKLSEREFELVNIVGAQLTPNQRDLSRHMDLSLGAINMLLRRLIAKGYIRIEALNKRKVKYLLTPKGFSEKMRKSVKYTLKTIYSIGLIKERLKKVLLQLYEKGHRTFFLLGESDLALLVENSFQEIPLKNCTVSRIQEIPQDKIEGIILVCKEETKNVGGNFSNIIDVINELAKDHFSIPKNKEMESYAR